jgi:putative transcriptional regulator
MPNAKRDIGREILQGLREIKRGQHGRVVNLPSVASIRDKTGLSQERFATLLGVSVRTLQDWEQGRRAPSGAARTLLLIAEHNSSCVKINPGSAGVPPASFLSWIAFNQSVNHPRAHLVDHVQR